MTMTDDEVTNHDESQDIDILLTKLPLTPGSDLSSKLLLQEPKIKNIIISKIIGKGINGDAYHIGSCDRHDGRKTDTLYMPNTKVTEDLPPIIVEVQQKVNHMFISRAIHYCLNVFEETKVLPILVVFNIDGFMGKSFFEKTFTIGQEPRYTLECHPWAKQTYIYNMDSIAKHMEPTPLDPMVALTLFFTLRQRHLLALDEYNDPTLNSIYRAAYYSFTRHHNIDTDTNTIFENFCDITSIQFEKIIKSIGSDTAAIKRTRAYAEDGILYINKMKRRHVESTSTDVTPIEESTSSDTNSDQQFVKRFRDKLGSKKMDWKMCYNQGIKENYFQRYKSHMTLKMAFHQNTL
ncbi:unnamed protein product [Absidia cylindrospora]